MKHILPLLVVLSALWAAPALAQQVACANVFTGCTNGTIAAGGGGSVSPANPTATAGPTANNGTATTYMRSDASPAVQQGTISQAGIVMCDGNTIACNAGTISTLKVQPTGGYNYIILGNSYSYQFGSLTTTSGIATVVFPVAMSVGWATASGIAGGTGYIVTGPEACNGPPITVCTFVVVDYNGTPAPNGTPISWSVISK